MQQNADALEHIHWGVDRHHDDLIKGSIRARREPLLRESSDDPFQFPSRPNHSLKHTEQSESNNVLSYSFLKLHTTGFEVYICLVGV